MAKATSTRTFSDLKYPTPASIKGRSSTIRAEFIKSIIPEIIPTQKAVEEALLVLNQDPKNLKCAYCSGKPSEWDHFFSAVSNKRPTGYITEIYNLVPSCGKCNQSKGKQYWKTWITGNAKLSPVSRMKRGEDITQIQLESNITALDNFEAWGNGNRVHINFQDDEEQEFDKYFKLCENLIDSLASYEEKAIELKKKVEAKLRS